ncbi:hypothetical protein Q1695_000013 [Nippostrongylus brasiliensis]|nr:hypothetical protein Q1695_000013 [Nippostrongylus brasiliensis]
MRGGTSVYRYVAVAAVVGISAAGLYLMWRKLDSKKKRLSVKELKDLGNKLFAAKKYADSIRVFSSALAAGNPCEDELVRAMCYQNRAAAKEYHGGYAIDDMLSDCEQALKHNPRYAKAYFRRARLLQTNQMYKESLISVFCATQLDPALDNQATQIIQDLLDHLEREDRLRWSSSLNMKCPRHVYTWLHKTVANDCIRDDVLNKKLTGNSGYERAIRLIRDKQYDCVVTEAVEENDACKLKALVLAARFYFYMNDLEMVDVMMEKFDSIYCQLTENEKGDVTDVMSSKYVFLIESGRTPASITASFAAAQGSTPGPNPDFVIMAAFRLVLCNEIRKAMELLVAAGASSPNITLLQLTLQILRNANNENNVPDMAVLHSNILQLENFVRSLQPKCPHALSILAKILATFSSDIVARDLSDEILHLEPNESIHYFDRSCMATSGKEAMENLEKCLALEPYHPEANLMYASLMMNEIGTREITSGEYKIIDKHIAIAEQSFDDNVDFPVLPAVFRLRSVVEAKKAVARILT